MVTFYRRLPKLDYIKPKTLDEVVHLLEKTGRGKALLYAGGTDVIPKLRERLIHAPEVLVDLKGIPELEYIAHENGDGARIGALATIYATAHDPKIREHFEILSKAADSIAANQIQQRGTIAGNICNGVPSADSAPALLCLGAQLLCSSARGERTIDIEKFFTGPGETLLEHGELLKEIQIPPLPEGSKGTYLKLSTRSRMDLAIVGVGVIISVENGVFRDARIALGAVAPTPIRAREAEEFLKGERVSEAVIDKAGQMASEASRPINDHRASADYRRMMVEVLVKRAIQRVTA